MGQTIGDVSQMIAYSGDLRRLAKVTPQPELAQKLTQSANSLEKAALSKAGIDNPCIGKLLDLIV